MWNKWNDQIIWFEYWNTGITCFTLFYFCFFSSSKECESDDCISVLFQINEFAEPNGWAVKCVCFGEHGLAVTISNSGTVTWLRFWRVATSGEITYLNYTSIPAENDCTYSLGMDTNFVIVSQRCTVSKIFIVSTETRKIVETLTDSSIKLVRYQQGLLIIQYASFIR